MKIGDRVRVIGFSTQGRDFDGLVGIIIRETHGLFVVEVDKQGCQCFKPSQLRRAPQKKQTSK